MTAGISKDVELLQSDRNWFGFLTLENFDAVVGRLRLMIGDGQRYAWVSAYEYRGYRPEVRTSQTVREGIKTHKSELEDGTGHYFFNVCDTYGVWGLGTTVADQRTARELEGSGSRRELTYLEVSARKIEIEFFTPEGLRAFWVVALEDHVRMEDVL